MAEHESVLWVESAEELERALGVALAHAAMKSGEWFVTGMATFLTDQEPREGCTGVFLVLNHTGSATSLPHPYSRRGQIKTATSLMAPTENIEWITQQVVRALEDSESPNYPECDGTVKKGWKVHGKRFDGVVVLPDWIEYHK